MGKVRDRFGGMGRFKAGLRCKGWVNSAIINVITEIIMCNCIKLLYHFYILSQCLAPSYDYKVLFYCNPTLYSMHFRSNIFDFVLCFEFDFVL